MISHHQYNNSKVGVLHVGRAKVEDKNFKRIEVISPKTKGDEKKNLARVRFENNAA